MEPSIDWNEPRRNCLRFPGLDRAKGLVHGVFTRMGGVSPPPYHSLNVGWGQGDSPAHVRANLRIVTEALCVPEYAAMQQVHGDSVRVLGRADGESPGPGGISETDALITDRPGIALIVRQADCQGVILYDEGREVLGVVHCGWRGHVLNILGSTVREMVNRFGCNAGEIRAAVGPSLGPCCAEFVYYQRLFPPSFEAFRHRKAHFDLWALSWFQLTRAGVAENRIEIAQICTRCRTDLFFSYRGEGTTGRFATAAALKPS